MKAFLLKYRSSLLLFAVMFLFGWGSAAVVAKWQSDRETEETMHIEAAVDNWGLGFGESGKELQPTGNATADELKQYDTYYIGSKEEKVIYLTFDCGYENGNTGAILDALKKHNAPGTFFVVGHFFGECAGIGQTDGYRGTHGGKSHLSSSGYVGNLGQRVVSERARCSQQFVSGSDRTGDDKVLQTTAGQIQYRESCDGKRIGV